MIFSGAEIVVEMASMGISHVVWVPDSELGKWEADIEASSIPLLRICREGEAWPLAAGLITGGQTPIVLMQTTGLFESGDALRNIVHDLRIPVFAVIGARSWRNASASDSAKTYAEPILRAWELDYVTIESRGDQTKLQSHYRDCQAAGQPGVVLLAE